jgi:ferritin
LQAVAALLPNLRNERNGRVLLTKIEAPTTEWKSPLDAFTEAYHHEKHISERIRALVK